MFQPKSLVALSCAQAYNVDADIKFCVDAIATEKAFARRIRRHYVPSALGYALKKLWTEDFKRVHMQGRERIHYLWWHLAHKCVNSHSDPATLLPRGYMQFGGGADDEVARTTWAVNKSWVLLDRLGIPRQEGCIPGRRQVHGLNLETIRACLDHRRTHSPDKAVEMRCRHNGGTNQICSRPPCVPLPIPVRRDPDVPASLATLFWDD